VTARALTLTINGERYDLSTEPHRTLLDVLRADLGLTGTKENCLEAECGVCTVLLDGRAVNACILLAAECDGRDVLTIEGLERGDVMHPLQQAMRDRHGFQCGFCTPGFLMTAYALLSERTDYTEEEWREELSGNLCRCTGYQQILEAARSVITRAADST